MCKIDQLTNYFTIRLFTKLIKKNYLVSLTNINFSTGFLQGQNFKIISMLYRLQILLFIADFQKSFNYFLFICKINGVREWKEWLKYVVFSSLYTRQNPCKILAFIPGKYRRTNQWKMLYGCMCNLYEKYSRTKSDALHEFRRGH